MQSCFTLSFPAVIYAEAVGNLSGWTYQISTQLLPSFGQMKDSVDWETELRNTYRYLFRIRKLKFYSVELVLKSGKEILPEREVLSSIDV